ncbi:PQQ-binding-like beta-propeller repeat protein [Natronobiforma cellulositropha]|uniref:PQQ-binding-like beta-propeller repeat protein n=1 Tax=Natronobiforma cellulositropha TaxID=1679076 RepID=UPI0021D611B1|nr:PQQ-binding-like beta-propeller repeat protein [Natronobiforma cellulositropha]
MVLTPTRRAVLASGSVALALGLAGCTSSLPGQSGGDSTAEWPSFRHDASNTGSNPDSPGPGPDLEIDWSVDVEPAAFESLDIELPPHDISSPLVLGDRVFVAFDFRGTLETGSRTRLVALDRDGGGREWVEEFPFEPDSGETPPPALTLESDGETLFLATKEAAGWSLRGLDPATGEEHWRESLEEPLHSSVTAFDGSLYAGGSALTVFDASDGSLEFRDEWDGPDGDDHRRWWFSNRPTVTDEAVYVGVGDRLRALDRDDGSLRWEGTSPFDSSTSEGGTWVSSPVVVDEVVYAATGGLDSLDLGGLVAYSAADGERLWKTQPARASLEEGESSEDEQFAGLYGLPVVVDDTVCAYGREYGEWGLFGLDAVDGSIRWYQDEVGSTGLAAGSDGTVYVHAAGGVAAVDPSDGDVLATAALDGSPLPYVQYPAVVDDRLYVATSEGVGAFARSDGS